MTKRIFSYPVSAEQEADSIRHLLAAHHIEFFETPASRWGFSNAAIWLQHDEDVAQTEHLLQQHHIEFAEQARQRFQLETGYDPNAPLAAKTVFSIKHLLKRKSALALLMVGIFLIYLYLAMFFSLFN
jgi:hypothetical protein